MLDASIPLQVKQPEVTSPMQSISGLMQLRGQMADIALRNQQVQASKQQAALIEEETAQKRRNVEGTQKLQNLLYDPAVHDAIGKGDFSPIWKAGISPDVAQPFVQNIQKMQETAQTLQKGKADFYAAGRSLLGKGLEGLDATNDEAAAQQYNGLRATLGAEHPELAQQLPQISSGPNFRQQLKDLAATNGVSRAILENQAALAKTQAETDASASLAKQHEADAAKTTALLPGEIEGQKTKNDQAARVLAGTSATGITGEEQQKNSIEAQKLAEEKRLHAMQFENVQLTPEALQKSAEMFATTGTLPQLGMGQAAARNRSAIINLAATQFPNVDFATNKAVYQANNDSLKSLQKNLDSVTAFENTAGKNLDTFLNTAKKVVDSGSPWINKPLREITQQGLGSEDMAAFNAARQTAVNEIAKVLNNPSASGALSDSARHEVDSLIGPNASLKQIYAAAGILKQDMRNRHDSYAEQVGAIKQRIGQSSADKPAGPKATHRYNLQTGQIEAIQ